MQSSERPAWLTRQEHGQLGEARARAFLLDRFWILERSVDVGGADLIIQRRLPARTLLDRDPPRLGYVQVKFFQDSETTQYIHKEYVLDSKGNPRREFFLLSYSGLEDSAKTYSLCAQDIAESFSVTSGEHSKPNCFKLPGRLVLDVRYEVVDRARVLDLFEQALRNADFVRNRQFMDWALPGLLPESGAVIPEFMEKIDNNFGDIPVTFQKLRSEARRVMWQTEEFGQLLAELANSDDPEEGIKIARDLESIGTVSLPGRFLDDDFETAVLEHRTRYDLLKSNGMLGFHAQLRREVFERTYAELISRTPASREDVLFVDVQYDPGTLGRIEISTEFAPNAANSLPAGEWSDGLRPATIGLINAVQGSIRAFLVPANYGYLLAVGGREALLAENQAGRLASVRRLARVSDNPEEDLRKEVKRVSGYLTSEIMQKVLSIQFDN